MWKKSKHGRFDRKQKTPDKEERVRKDEGADGGNALQNYAIALLERIAYQTSLNRSLEFVDYLKMVREDAEKRNTGNTDNTGQRKANGDAGRLFGGMGDESIL